MRLSSVIVDAVELACAGIAHKHAQLPSSGRQRQSSAAALSALCWVPLWDRLGGSRAGRARRESICALWSLGGGMWPLVPRSRTLEQPTLGS